VKYKIPIQGRLHFGDDYMAKTNMDETLIFIVIVSKTSQIVKWCLWVKMFCDV